MPDNGPIRESLDKMLEKIPSTGRGFSESLFTKDGFRSEVGQKIAEGWGASAFVGSKWGSMKSPEFGVLIKGKW